MKALFVVLAVLMFASGLLARSAEQQQRIDYLIGSLSNLKGAVFIRNGSEYDAAKARSHLQEKLQYAGERVKTAEDFVRLCASESSVSHRPYQIRFADGKIVTTAEFFGAKLKEFDQRKQ